jgi:hypothetical protein
VLSWRKWRKHVTGDGASDTHSIMLCGRDRAPKQAVEHQAARCLHHPRGVVHPCTRPYSGFPELTTTTISASASSASPPGCSQFLMGESAGRKGRGSRVEGVKEATGQVEGVKEATGQGGWARCKPRLCEEVWVFQQPRHRLWLFHVPNGKAVEQRRRFQPIAHTHTRPAASYVSY